MKHILSFVLAVLITGLSVVSCAKNNGDDTATSEIVSADVVTEKSSDISDTDSTTYNTVYTDSDVTEEDSSEVKPTDTEDTEVTTVPPEDEITLDLYAGWWGRPDGYIKTEMTVSDVIYIDANESTWTIYTKYGAKGETYECYLNDGVLTLDYGSEGYIPLDYKDGALLNIYRMTEYVQCEPLEEINTEIFEGKWYRFDDTDDTYYEVKGGVCTFIEDGKASFEGEWYSEKGNRFVVGKGDIEEDQFVVTDDASTVVFAVSDEGMVIYDPEGKTAFIYESVIGTEKGDDLVRKYTLICGKWQDVANSNTYIVFEYYDSDVMIENVTENGSGNTNVQSAKIGTWDLDGFELMIIFNDESEEITPFDPSEIRVSTFNASYRLIK